MHADRTGEETALLLRKCAAGRKAFADTFRRDKALSKVVDLLELQAITLESAAQIAEGHDGPLYDLMPAHMWTDEMHNALHGEPADLTERTHCDR